MKLKKKSFNTKTKPFFIHFENANFESHFEFSRNHEWAAVSDRGSIQIDIPYLTAACSC